MIELYDLITEMNDQEICELIESLREEIRALEVANRAIWRQYHMTIRSADRAAPAGTLESVRD